ncbi:Transcription factor bHLH25 [Spatholobus suberectus]|nr:Transcription factor bHLH25 [Spatholobus suberectus]
MDASASSWLSDFVTNRLSLFLSLMHKGTEFQWMIYHFYYYLFYFILFQLLQETEDCSLFRQCHLNLLDDDEELLSHEIASALNGENLQQPLSSESSSSFERPTKQPKTNTCSWNSSTSPSSPIDNSNSSPANNTQFYGLVSTLCPKQNKGVSVSPPQTRKGSSQNQNFETESPKDRGSTHTRDHIIAERKRREKLSQSLIALAALIPGLKKMDKASVLGDAIKYVKELQERLRMLEEQNKNRDVESMVIVNKPQLSCDDHSPSRDDDGFDDGSGRETLPRVEATVSDMDVLLRIHCQKQKGLLLKILVEIQNLHLFVVNSSVLPFGDSILAITIVAQMGTGYNLTINDLVKNVRVATLKSMS